MNELLENRAKNCAVNGLSQLQVVQEQKGWTKDRWSYYCAVMKYAERNFRMIIPFFILLCCR